MPDLKELISQKIPFINRIDWIIVFGLLPLVIAILAFLVLMIINEVDLKGINR